MWLGFPPFDKAAEENAIKVLDERFSGLRKATPGGGSYMNEVSFHPFDSTIKGKWRLLLTMRATH